MLRLWAMCLVLSASTANAQFVMEPANRTLRCSELDFARMSLLAVDVTIEDRGQLPVFDVRIDTITPREARKLLEDFGVEREVTAPGRHKRISALLDEFGTDLFIPSKFALSLPFRGYNETLADFEVSSVVDLSRDIQGEFLSRFAYPSELYNRIVALSLENPLSPFDAEINELKLMPLEDFERRLDDWGNMHSTGLHWKNSILCSGDTSAVFSQCTLPGGEDGNRYGFGMLPQDTLVNLIRRQGESRTVRLLGRPGSALLRVDFASFVNDTLCESDEDEVWIIPERVTIHNSTARQ